MTAYNYIESVNSNLICCICHAPFIEPTTTKSCCHTFCKDCITHALNVTPQCPIDRSSLSEDDLRPANPIVRCLVDELIVECPRRSDGCLHTCQRQCLSTHLKDDCQFIKVTCCQEQCEATVLKKDVMKHSDSCKHRIVQCGGCGVRVQFVHLQLHHDQCPAEEVTCPHCTSVIPLGNMASHAAICPDFVIECNHTANGCPWTGPRDVLTSSHLPQCPYESLKGFFSLNDLRLSTLEAENTQLRGKIEELEGALRLTTRDMQTARHALGPWFRPAGCHTPSHPPPHPSEPAPRPYQRRRLSNALNSAMFGFPVDPNSSIETSAAQPALHSLPNGSQTPVDPLAQFFPPTETATQPYSISSETLASTVDGTYPRYAPNSSVAPINLNTTLEGSLTSLRSSIVTLAGSLDSESRRHDIALTTETLRVNEEVGSLRAIVHGLRMQVHQIMMDRNSQVTGRQGDGDDYLSNSRPSIVDPWTSSVSSVRYLNHLPPINRPISIGHTTTTHIQTTKL